MGPSWNSESEHDVLFDFGGRLTRPAEESSYNKGGAFVTGNDTNKPTWFLNGTPVTTTDDPLVSPSRAFGTLQYVPSGSASGSPNYAAASPEDGGPADCLYRLI